MPEPIRFHLDENVDHAIAYGLRRHRIDVSVTAEVGLLHASDEEQLAFAHSSARVLVTHDEDFLILHNGGLLHAGIAYCPPDMRPIGRIIRSLLLISGVMEVGEMTNHVEFL